MTDAAEVDLPRRPAGEEPREFRVQVGDLSITAFEWAGEGRPVLLAHATGFHARTWDAVARLLPGHRVVAVDFRGHGRSDNPEPPILWSHFAQDLVAVAEHAGLEGVVGVGHSMGGRCVTFAAAAAPSRFASLLLIDPVMFNHQALEDAPSAPPPSGAFHFVAKRRNEWASPEEMVERFRDRFPYNAWAPGVLEDYAKWGLLPNPDGEGLVLACPPAIEASIYGSSASEPPGVQADAIRAV